MKHPSRRRRIVVRCGAVVLGLLSAACQSSAGELGGLAEGPPLDYAVLVSGGAYLLADTGRAGTFAGATEPVQQLPVEAIPMAAVLEVLRQGRVFQRVEPDPDPEHRRVLQQTLQARPDDPALQAFLQDARDRGFDLLLVVEELRDGATETQGINGRWPVTFFTWILLGLGLVIPDHTFESRATLRVTVRDLQTGAVLHDPLLVGGPIELSLTERSDYWGLLASILVPPFWVGDDVESLRASVRGVVERRLLLSMARDLKSESVRQRLRERGAASLSLVDDRNGPQVVVDTAESLSVARLAGGADPAAAATFERELLASMRREGERFRYRATLPALPRGAVVQVLVGTLRGDVASATFAPGRPQ
jgi:hypothetical protein